MEKVTRRAILCVSLGLLLGFIGIGMATSGNFAFDTILRTQMTLSPHSANFPMWQDLPMPIKTSMYLFNVTNADDFLYKGAKPQLQEVGPYVFHEFHKKVDLVWHDNGTVTYKQVRTFFWSPEESVGQSLSDTFTLLNVPAATVGAMASSMPSKRGLINFGLGLIGEKLFVQKTAREILFDGYKDPVLNAAEFIQIFKVPMPGLMDKFGFYYARNGSDWYDGVFNMYTGATDIDKLGQVATWNYSSHPDYFPAPCGNVEGAGDFFSPHLDKTFAQLYSNDLCRPIVLNYSSPGSVKGVPGLEYRVASTYFANSQEHPSNWCFEAKGKDPLPSGVYNLSACRFGAPIFMSQPHFYQADPYYIDQVHEDSLSPNRTKHETVFIIESQSGIPISVTARFQVNVLVEQMDEVGLFKHIPKRTFFPVIWFESKFDLADSLVGEMWILSHLKSFFLIGGLFMISIGLASVVVTAIYYSVLRSRDDALDNQSQPILQNASLEDDSEQENKYEEEDESGK